MWGFTFGTAKALVVNALRVWGVGAAGPIKGESWLLRSTFDVYPQIIML